MTTYYVDDGGSATAPYDTWAKAATSLSALDDAVALASGDIVYIGHDHVCQYVHAASRTITGPAASPPVTIISATQGSSPPAYQASSTDQIDTSEGAYDLTFTGVFALYGIRMKSGGYIHANTTSNYSFLAYQTTFALAANGFIGLGDGANTSHNKLIACTVDLTADGSTPRSAVVFQGNTKTDLILQDPSFVNAGYRTGVVFNFGGGSVGNKLRVSGGDFSGFTNATACEIFGGVAFVQTTAVFSNIKTAATWTPTTGTPALAHETMFVNAGNADAPVYLYAQGLCGSVTATPSIYRTSGATIEGTACAWLATTTASASLYLPLCSPWIYGRIASTGSKTFDVYITNDTADFDDDEVWLEVEYKGTASSGKWTPITDQIATITTTPAAQTDDTSTWNGTGPAFTYKQKLSVTATVNTTGLFRARVCCGVASIAASRYFYIDPKVTVT